MTGRDEPKNWDEFFNWWGSLPGYVVFPDDPPLHFVRRFTPGDPHGVRFLVIGAANPFAAVHDAARKWGDAGEGRVTRRPDAPGGSHLYARRLREGLAVHYEVRTE